MDYLLIFLAVSFISVSQILQKLAVLEADKLEQNTHLLHRVALRREIWWAIACLVIGTLLWLSVLYRMEVSRAFPFLSLGFILVMLASRFYLQEKISLSRWIGVGLIIAGIILLSLA
jgi:drug/metabolite transporter (DMT)-like permease